MSFLRTLVVSVSAAATIACSSGIVSPQDITRFSQAKARWDTRPFADYSFEVRTFCFCPPEIAEWTRVSVRSGVVVAAEAVVPDPNHPITTLTYWQPIDSLFSNLRRAMDESILGSYYSAIIVTYDQQLGFPISIEYRSKPNIADAGATITVRNVGPLN